MLVKEPERGCAGGAVGALLARKPHLAEVKPLVEAGTLRVPVPGGCESGPAPCSGSPGTPELSPPRRAPGFAASAGKFPARRGIVCNCVGDGLRRAQVIA